MIHQANVFKNLLFIIPLPKLDYFIYHRHMQRREGGSLICDSERNYQIGIGEHSTHRTGDMRRDHWVIPLRQLWFIVLVNLLTNDSIAAQAFTSFDDSPSPSDNYIPRSRPDFNFADIPCDLKENNFCTRAGKAYPWYGIGSFIADNRAMIKRLYGSENQRGPSANHAQGPITTRQGKSVAGTGTNACPSEQFVVTPFWANNSDGNTLALVNFHPFEQAIQQEICKTGVQGRCRDGCQCEQKHAWYRLLAFDPRNECKGIFMDWFQFPSCCSCNCYDNLPVRDASSSSTTPSTSTLPTVEAKSDEGLSAKLINVSAMAEGPPTTSQLSTSSLTSQKTVSHTSSSINITTTSTSTLLPKVILRSAGLATTNAPATTTMTQSSSSSPVSDSATVVDNDFSTINNSSGPIERALSFNDSVVSVSDNPLTSTAITFGLRSRNITVPPIKAVSPLSSSSTARTTVANAKPSLATASKYPWTRRLTSTSTSRNTSAESAPSDLTSLSWLENVLPSVDPEQDESIVIRVVDAAIRRNRVPRI